ncbi:Zn-dependent peptidase M16 family protein (plasmid) [Rhizobium etli]|uniref:Zn-dependent peptidase M16 family protein n=1 Tax=Rhizobium etli TaxID=29449 RepID=A0AAN1BLH7_RHIET|nr:pitrilysin family protein [Rhizobium etli]ARQ13445.1 Zn-dependent peptidase M16 family protein [Rhizobium etli]
MGTGMDQISPLQASRTLEAATASEDWRRGPEIASFLLDNGMEVVVIPDHRMPIVTHMVWYKAGGADEPPGRSGIAHFLEHLMFKGTRNHPAGEFDARVAEIGGRQNAFTGFDYTAYHQMVTPEALGTMMEYEADRMRHLLLTDEVVAPEREVVREERRMRYENEPHACLDEALRATLYQNHPYRIRVIGWMHEIEQLNREDALAFYDRYYHPNNAILVVAGDVDSTTVRKLAEKTYGAIPRGGDLPPRVRPQEPKQDTKRTIVLTDPRVTVPEFEKSWVTTSYGSSEPGEAEALDLLSELLGGGWHSRLYQELVVKRGIAGTAGAYFNGTSLDPSSFGVYGAPRGDATIEEVENAIDDEVEKITAGGVTGPELERAKSHLIRSMIFRRDSPAGVAMLYGKALTTGRTVDDLHAWPLRIRAVTPKDVQSAARKYLNLDHSVTGYLLPCETSVSGAKCQ